jgi:predicted DsbA family dithiol-disulfide isomerase
MPRAEAEAHLQNAALHSQTMASDQAAREMGVTGVPFFIFNRRVGLSGAHEPNVLLRAMTQSLQEPTA